MDTITVSKNKIESGIIAIANPLMPTSPLNKTAFNLYKSNDKNKLEVIPVDEFLIRNNLPSATQFILEKLKEFK